MTKVSHPGRPGAEKERSPLSQSEQPFGAPSPEERDMPPHDRPKEAPDEKRAESDRTGGERAQDRE